MLFMYPLLERSRKLFFEDGLQPCPFLTFECHEKHFTQFSNRQMGSNLSLGCLSDLQKRYMWERKITDPGRPGKRFLAYLDDLVQCRI